MAIEGQAAGLALLPPDDLAPGATSDEPSAVATPATAAALGGHEDRYSGIIVDPATLPADAALFPGQLDAALAIWASQGKRGIWLKLLIQRANLILPAVEAGFIFHHAEADYVMLTLWLPPSPSTLPPNASHQIGIGAFVMNDAREVLAVQERNGPLRGSGVWKMPTGLVNQDEDISAAAVREVKEETGIDAEFLELTCFRQSHQVAFGKSDLFFVCILRPLSSEITKQDSEIEDSKWMPLADFAAQPIYQRSEMLKKMLDLCIATAEGMYKGFVLDKVESGFGRAPQAMYWGRYPWSRV
eukprot:SM000062S19943  [mRNA]  locus=s62:490816:493037:- [translate_table: standard]